MKKILSIILILALALTLILTLLRGRLQTGKEASE